MLFGGLHVDTAANDPSTGAFSAPPVAGASASKSVVDAGQSVTQTGTVSHGLDPVLLRVSFGDGANGSASTAAHTYARSRLATADLTVTDLAGGAHRRA
ncbi:MAG: PKD domain-containing protein [Thermoplasmata archaeon]